MKNKTKKIMTLAMGAVLAGVVMVSPVKAASTVTGTLNGGACRGTISYNSTSATAATSWDHSGGTRTVTVYAYYTNAYGITHSSASNIAYSGGISATATRSTGYTSPVIGGRGIHKVTYQSGAYDLKWTPANTTIGTVN